MKLNDVVKISHEVRQWVRQIPQVKQVIDNVSDLVDDVVNKKPKKREPLNIKPRKDYDDRP